MGARKGSAPASIKDRATEAVSGAAEPLPDPDDVYDAGALGCGDGPLTFIAARLRGMQPDQVLEIRSTDPGVAADLPAWCRMVGHTFLGGGQDDYAGRYFVRRKA